MAIAYSPALGTAALTPVFVADIGGSLGGRSGASADAPHISFRAVRVKGPAETKSTKSNMNQRSLSCNCTEEDRRTRTKWMRTIAIFYGCMALLVFGLIVLTKSSRTAPNDTADHQTWPAGRQDDSVQYAPLISLASQMQAGGVASTRVRADDASGALYPGQYVTNCKPASIVGCVCESDSAGQKPQLLSSMNESVDDNRRIQDIEHSRMIEWMRLTCIAVTQSGRLH